MNKEEWCCLGAAVGLVVLAFVLSLFAPLLAKADDLRVMIQVRTSTERAAQCRAEGGCALVTHDDMQRFRAEGALDVVRMLDNHGCLKDNKT